MRREFLKAALALTVSVSGRAQGKGRGASVGEVPRRKLGRTGAVVSVVGVGGAHIGFQDSEQESIRIIRGAIDGGITFLDNCWDYNAERAKSGWERPCATAIARAPS